MKGKRSFFQSSFLKGWAFLFTAGLFLTLVTAHFVWAETFTINDGDITGLINSINAANNEVNYPGSDIINLAVDGTYTLTDVQNFTNGANGLPSIISAISIHGNGATIERDADLNTPTFRIFHVSAGGSLTLENVTIKNGIAGVIDIDYTNGGGGILNYGTVAITNSTLSENSAFNGGGIYNTEGDVTITSSILLKNSAYNGGGICNMGGEVIITNSTFSENDAHNQDGMGGGIFNLVDGMIRITSSTFFGNSAYEGGGISNDGASLEIKNSIVANSFPGSNCFNSDNFVTLGTNFDTDGSCPDFITVAIDELKLGTLQNNGGFTRTYALLFGSVAIDATIDCTLLDGVSPLTEDQCGRIRPIDFDSDGINLCDVGAYEAYDPDIGITKTVNNNTPNENEEIYYTITLSAIDTGNDALGILVEDHLPGGVIFDSSVADTGTYDPASGEWYVEEIAPPISEVTLTIFVRVDELTGANNTITNTATIVDSMTSNDNPLNDTDTAVITVNADADTPNLSVSPASGDEDTDIPISISASLTDTDGSETLSIQISGVPNGATLSAGSDLGGGIWELSQVQLTGLTIRPPENDDSDFTLTVTATSTELSNGDTATMSANIDVTVWSVNDPPVANNDPDITTDEDTPVVIHVADNDTDVEGNLDPNTANTDCTTCSLPSNGTLVNNGDGTFTYTPNPYYAGDDSFEYQICDTENECDTATVYIHVEDILDKADLRIRKIVNVHCVDEGQTIIYTITITNYGPHMAYNVEVTDLLPTGLIYISDSSQGNYNHNNGIWEVGSLANGMSTTLEIRAQVYEAPDYDEIEDFEFRTKNISTNSRFRQSTYIPEYLTSKTRLSNTQTFKLLTFYHPNTLSYLTYNLYYGNRILDVYHPVSYFLPTLVNPWTNVMYYPFFALGYLNLYDPLGLYRFADTFLWPCFCPFSSSITNQAEITASDPTDPSPANNIDTATITVCYDPGYVGSWPNGITLEQPIQMNPFLNYSLMGYPFGFNYFPYYNYRSYPINPINTDRTYPNYMRYPINTLIR